MLPSALLRVMLHEEAFRFPVVVFGERSDHIVLRATRPQVENLIHAGCVVGIGHRSRVRALRMTSPVPAEDLGNASLHNVRRLPCVGDVSKAFTVIGKGENTYRQWRMNPHPRPRPDQNRRNNGGAAFS
jgi:hypothetical protein